LEGVATDGVTEAMAVGMEAAGFGVTEALVVDMEVTEVGVHLIEKY
jgi:hypothetical protein